MKANIATLRQDLSNILEKIQTGEECEVQKRNITIAKIIPIKPIYINKTKLGKGVGSCEIIGDIVNFSMESDWEMLNEDGESL